MFFRTILSLLVFAAAAFGAVPQQINYQGTLTRPDGTPLDTVVSMTFSLYDQAGDPPLWTETQPACTVRAGLFAAALGSVIPIPNTMFLYYGRLLQMWLGIAVGNDAEMTPQIAVQSVPYARVVGTLSGAMGGTVFGEIRTDTLHLEFGIRFPDGSFQNSAGGGGGQQYSDTSTYDATRTWVQSNGYLRGANNVISATGFVGGGRNNYARGDYAVVAGGGGTPTDSNSAIGNYSAIGGGRSSTASGNYATVGGGYNSTASGEAATLGGGSYNFATDSAATVGGGRYNRARGRYSVVAGGGGASLADSNSASGNYSAIGGGCGSTASGNYTTVGGGSSNEATISYATVSGGFGSTASSYSATVGGGYSNDAAFGYATVGGGANNNALGNYATVGGGSSNDASDNSATVGGGGNNTASGIFATIPGGNQNRATGDYSFAAGRRAQTNGEGVFAWADATGDTFSIGLANSFNARASNGFRFWTTSDITQNIGARLPAGGSSWTTLSDSTKKRNIRLVDTKDVLDKVAQMPIKQWSYQSQDPSIEHIGPMAQDFWMQFHLGDDSLSISTIDPSGIALAAIQELAKRNEKLEARSTTMEAEISELRSRLSGDDKHLAELRTLVQTLAADKQQSSSTLSAAVK